MSAELQRDLSQGRWPETTRLSAVEQVFRSACACPRATRHAKPPETRTRLIRTGCRHLFVLTARLQWGPHARRAVHVLRARVESTGCGAGGRDSLAVGVREDRRAFRDVMDVRYRMSGGQRSSAEPDRSGMRNGVCQYPSRIKWSHYASAPAPAREACFCACDVRVPVRPGSVLYPAMSWAAFRSVRWCPAVSAEPASSARRESASRVRAAHNSPWETPLRQATRLRARRHRGAPPCRQQRRLCRRRFRVSSGETRSAFEARGGVTLV